MKKLTKILLVTALVLSLGGSAAASVAAASLHDALEEVRCAAVRGGLSLRARVAGLEEKLAGAAPCPEVPAEADAGGTAADAAADNAADNTIGNAAGCVADAEADNAADCADNSAGGCADNCTGGCAADDVPCAAAPAGAGEADAPNSAAAAGADGADVPCAAGMDEVTAPAAHAAAAPAEVYVVRAYNGIIGVFDGDGALFRTVNTAVPVLPEADREALAAGVTVEGFDALEALLAVYE